MEKSSKGGRFNGTSEEEILKKTLPHYLKPDLDILIIGINPGLYSAHKGHHYAGHNNHFWKCFNVSGLTPEPMTYQDDHKLLEYGIGFTNIVERATRGSKDLSKQEILDGCKVLHEKLKVLRPRIAVFNGKKIYEIFSGKTDFIFGLQPGYIEGTETFAWAMPSSSARSSHHPTYVEKLPFYKSLKKFLVYINNEFKVDKEEFMFPSTSEKLSSGINSEKNETKSEYFESENIEDEYPVKKKRKLN